MLCITYGILQQLPRITSFPPNLKYHHMIFTCVKLLEIDFIQQLSPNLSLFFINHLEWHNLVCHSYTLYLQHFTLLFSSYGNYTFKTLETNLKTLVQRFAKYCSHFTTIQRFMPKMYYIGYIYPSKFIWQKDIIFPNSRIVELLSYVRQFFSKLQRKVS